jgi:hypothetical protein
MIDESLNENSVNFPTRRALMIGLVAVMLVLAGCGGGGGGDGEETTAASGGGETTVADETTGAATTTSRTMTTTGGGTSMVDTTSMAETMTPESGTTMAQTEAGGGPQTTAAGTSAPSLSGTPSGPYDDQFYLSVIEIAFNQSDRNISVVSAETQENVVNLRYVTTATNQSDVLYEIGFVGGAYAATLDEGWDVDRMNVTAVTSAGKPVRTFYIESSWARQYINEEISTEEFVSQVRGTVETQSNTTGTATGTNSTA